MEVAKGPRVNEGHEHRKEYLAMPKKKDSPRPIWRGAMPAKQVKVYDPGLKKKVWVDRATQFAPQPVIVGEPTREGAAAGRRYAPAWLRKQVLERDRYRCRYCKIQLTDKTANIDHIKPWPFGLTELHNLATACGPCNQDKGNLTRSEWRRKKRNASA